MEAQAPPAPTDSRAPNPFAGYSHEHRPLAGYAVLTAAFTSAVVGAAVAARVTGRRPPEQIGLGDVAMLGLATHKLSRLIAKDKVTSFLRAPFTQYQEASGHGEVEEKPRGDGLRYAVGELLVCPYCLAQWVSGAFAAGSVFAPRLTRLIAASYTAETIADFLQLAYHAAEERA